MAFSLLLITITGRECIALYNAGELHPHLSKDQHFELFFLAWGRLAVVLVFAAILSLDLMVKSNAIELPEADFHQTLGQRSRGATIDLALLICIVGPTSAVPPARKSYWRSLINRLAFGAAALLTILLLSQDTFIHFLVYLAVRGIEQAEGGQPVASLTSEGRFGYLLAFHAAAMLMIVAAVHYAATHWQAQRSRIAMLFVIAAALSALAFSAIRQVVVGLQELSPAMYEGIMLGPIHRWLISVVLVIMACAAWAYLVIRRSNLEVPAGSVAVARAWHVRALAPAIILFLYTLTGAFVVYHMADSSFATFDWDDPLWTLASTDYYLSMALWLTAVAQVYRAWRDRKAPSFVHLHGLPPSQFLTVMLFNVAVTAIGGFIAAWLSFALWLTPWYRWFG